MQCSSIQVYLMHTTVMMLGIAAIVFMASLMQPPLVQVQPWACQPQHCWCTENDQHSNAQQQDASQGAGANPHSTDDPRQAHNILSAGSTQRKHRHQSPAALASRQTAIRINKQHMLAAGDSCSSSSRWCEALADASNRRMSAVSTCSEELQQQEHSGCTTDVQHSCSCSTSNCTSSSKYTSIDSYGHVGAWHMGCYGTGGYGNTSHVGRIYTASSGWGTTHGRRQVSAVLHHGVTHHHHRRRRIQVWAYGNGSSSSSSDSSTSSSSIDVVDIGEENTPDMNRYKTRLNNKNNFDWADNNYTAREASSSHEFGSSSHSSRRHQAINGHSGSKLSLQQLQRSRRSPDVGAGVNSQDQANVTDPTANSPVNGVPATALQAESSVTAVPSRLSSPLYRPRRTDSATASDVMDESALTGPMASTVPSSAFAELAAPGLVLVALGEFPLQDRQGQVKMVGDCMWGTPCKHAS